MYISLWQCFTVQEYRQVTLNYIQLKSVLKITLAVVLFATTFSCAKDDMAREDSNCYVGTVQSQSLELKSRKSANFW